MAKIRNPGLRGYLDCNHFESCQTQLNHTTINYSESTVASLPDSVTNDALLEIACPSSDDGLNLPDRFSSDDRETVEVEFVDSNSEETINHTSDHLKEYLRKESCLSIQSLSNMNDNDEKENIYLDMQIHNENKSNTNANIVPETMVWAEWNNSEYLFAVILHQCLF